MTILVVSPRPPWPPSRADAMTVERLVRFLAARGHTVDLLCTVDNRRSGATLRAALGSVFRRIEAVVLPRPRRWLRTASTLAGGLPLQVQYYRSPKVARRLADMVGRGRYDVVYTHLIRMAEYTRGIRLPKVLAMQVSQALNLRRMVEHTPNPVRRLAEHIELGKVRRYEAGVAAGFDYVLLCGQPDIEELRRTREVDNAVICPHGQSIPAEERLRAARKVAGAVVFSGVMSAYPNVEAAGWFARNVFPLVARACPEARLWIVGREPSRAVRSLARLSRVVVSGEVPDVSEWLLRAEVAVAPMRIAAGMQNKVVQAMACGLPVVASSVANEGIGATPGVHLLIADDAESTARAVAELLGDAELRARLGRAARALAEERWTWRASLARIETILQELAERGH